MISIELTGGGPIDGGLIEIPTDEEPPYYDVLENGTVWHRYVQVLIPRHYPPRYNYMGIREDSQWWHK